MQREKILVVGFGRIEPIEVLHASDDWRRKYMGFSELRDIRLSNAALILIDREHGRAILRAAVGTLVVQFSRIMRDREKDLQQTPIRDLRRVVSDLYRFRMTGVPFFDGVVVC